MEGILKGKRYLIHDRDPLYTTEFLTILKAVGVPSIKLPPRSPNLNAYAERFVRSIKESCHQGLANRLILPEAGHLENSGAVQRRQRLSGMLNYYYRAAA
jgi:transposase InsO family protein